MGPPWCWWWNLVAFWDFWSARSDHGPSWIPLTGKEGSSGHSLRDKTSNWSYLSFLLSLIIDYCLPWLVYFSLIKKNVFAFFESMGILFFLLFYSSETTGWFINMSNRRRGQHWDGLWVFIRERETAASIDLFVWSRRVNEQNFNLSHGQWIRLYSCYIHSPWWPFDLIWFTAFHLCS